VCGHVPMSLSTARTATSMAAPMLFLDKMFYYWKVLNITPNLCITKMHTTVQHKYEYKTRSWNNLQKSALGKLIYENGRSKKTCWFCYVIIFHIINEQCYRRISSYFPKKIELLYICNWKRNGYVQVYPVISWYFMMFLRFHAREAIANLLLLFVRVV
jgi:hypothetical protein